MTYINLSTRSEARTSPHDPFRSDFSRTIFKNKYAHEGAETWPELCRTLAFQVCGGIMPTDEIEQLAQYMTLMKFIPGGRYLYYAGRENPFFNNCFDGTTKFLTTDGMVPMNRYRDGEVIQVYSPVEKDFVPATMHTHGEQELYEFTFANVRGRSTKTWTVRATEDHKWLTKNRGTVTDLRVGDVIPSAAVNLPQIEKAFVHGMVYADGNRHVLKHHFSHQLRLCGPKTPLYEDLMRNYGTVSHPHHAQGDAVVYITSPRDLKELPSVEEDGIAYVASFLHGWLAMDGHFGDVYQIHTISREAIEFFEENAHLAGYIVSGSIKEETKPTNYGERKNPLYRLNFRPATDFQGFKVVSKRHVGREVVYCPFEPLHNRIVIGQGMDTYQCYLLRAEEDTREDWAELSWKSESALMTGGGIGIDYSVYRPAGSLIKRTGGQASGPIPKMLMINEIGRRVMQGGSRRSAMYGSLRWSHQDAEELLTIKDWDAQVVEGTGGLTIGDLKRADFNYPAPLDMTNISLNYDTEWLLKTYEHGSWRHDSQFRKHVAQALKTGEPGWSFNFFDKENETLRNACTEVSSEDDSDV